MPVKQQFIVEIENATVLDLQELVDQGPVKVLLKDRAAAECLFNDLGEALGPGNLSRPYVPSEDATIRRILRDFEQPVSKEAEDMSTWSAAQIEAFFATAGESDDANEEGDIDDPLPTNPEAAAAAQQALSRRELQMTDPANKDTFQPHVGYTVPPTEKRGSAIGAIRLNQEPEQAF